MRGAVIAIAFAVTAIWMAPIASAAPTESWWVCHRTGAGAFNVKYVGSTNAKDAHLAHGDPEEGAIPTAVGFPDCSVF